MDISDYRERIAEHSPCAGGLSEFMSAHTRSDVFRCIIDGNNTDFFLASMRDGWGPETADLERIFARHINGPIYGDVTMWCGYSGLIMLSREVRRVVLCGCGEVRLELPDDCVYLKVQMCGDGSNIVIAGPRTAFVQVRKYSGAVSVDGPDARVYDR